MLDLATLPLSQIGQLLKFGVAHLNKVFGLSSSTLVTLILIHRVLCFSIAPWRGDALVDSIIEVTDLVAGYEHFDSLLIHQCLLFGCRLLALKLAQVFVELAHISLLGDCDLGQFVR